MTVNKRISLITTLTLGLITAAWLAGCGSATNNDQGVAFTLLGFYSADDVDDAEGCDSPTGTLGLFSTLNASGTDPASGTTAIFAGLQNNLSQQFIRTDRAFITYNVTGASRQPPDTSVPLGTIIFPSVSDSTSENSSAGFVSSLPPAFGGAGCSRGYAGFEVVPADIITWLNFNRTALPELPFRLDATVEVTGVTSAGDRYTSNPMTFFVDFLADVPINEPTEGDTGDTGDTGAISEDTSGVVFEE